MPRARAIVPLNDTSMLSSNRALHSCCPPNRSAARRRWLIPLYSSRAQVSPRGPHRPTVRGVHCRASWRPISSVHSIATGQFNPWVVMIREAARQQIPEGALDERAVSSSPSARAESGQWWFPGVSRHGCCPQQPSSERLHGACTGLARTAPGGAAWVHAAHRAVAVTPWNAGRGIPLPPRVHAAAQRERILLWVVPTRASGARSSRAARCDEVAPVPGGARG